MKILFSTLKKVLFWSYERGSWQYDVMCVLILAFVFLGPNSVFHNHKSLRADEEAAWPKLITREDLGHLTTGSLDERLSAHLTKKYGRRVEITRSEPVMDGAGSIIGYRAWEK